MLPASAARAAAAGFCGSWGVVRPPKNINATSSKRRKRAAAGPWPRTPSASCCVKRIPSSAACSVSFLPIPSRCCARVCALRLRRPPQQPAAAPVCRSVHECVAPPLHRAAAPAVHAIVVRGRRRVLAATAAAAVRAVSCVGRERIAGARTL
eukprot:358645-Chlamydomonas_euryale.AAC.12